ncbi:hypothetical protein [Deinococcus yunweiensis]|uniref:hypothetical protein n=1 Tax=Deinococcus yunweiensis TaxID=367282 RepID=UPI00398F8800
MASISHISADGPSLGCSNSLLSGIVERALLHAQDEPFIVALQESEWLGDIDLYLFSAEYRMIFAEAAEALADEIAARTDEYPAYVARVRIIAAEVRKTIGKECAT